MKRFYMEVRMEPLPGWSDERKFPHYYIRDRLRSDIETAEGISGRWAAYQTLEAMNLAHEMGQWPIPGRRWRVRGDAKLFAAVCGSRARRRQPRR